MSYYVYLLINTSKKNISYVGYTNNLSKRIKLHNSGKGAKFTRGRIWELIFKQKYSSKKIAMREEYKLKKNYRLRKYIKLRYLDKINNRI
jgi:putative endonuclease